MINAHSETPCVHTQTTRRSLAVVSELLWQTPSTCTSPSAAPEDKWPGKWCSGSTLSQEQHLDQTCVVCVCVFVCMCMNAGAALCSKDNKLHMTSMHTHTYAAPFHAGVTHKHPHTHTHTHTHCTCTRTSKQQNVRWLHLLMTSRFDNACGLQFS